jgi:hypothetical protein
MSGSLGVQARDIIELSDLGKLLAETSARHAALEKTDDLHTAAVITEMGRLQIFTQIRPPINSFSKTGRIRKAPA